MSRKIVLPVLIGLLFGIAGCFPEVESDLQNAIDRDDRLLADYLSRNNIDATETQLGYFYKKIIPNETGNQIINNDIIGVYYEIRTIDGQLIENYTDESKSPKIYKHTEGGLIPRAINFASGLAKVGETFSLYIPSYLAYQEYNYQQLILPNSNLVVKVKYAETYTNAEIKEMEEEMILDYISEKNLEGFVKTADSIYVKTVKEGEAESKVATNRDEIRFTYKILQLDSENPIAQSTGNTPFQIMLGSESNPGFLNLSLKGLKKGQEIEVIIPSRLGFGLTAQVFPFSIRKDLFDKGYITQIARPFEPIIFKVAVTDIK
ncbi:FKBP-type peptidyl-prolyl cis-trans isomerase [Cognataquiflexum rubidum]|uniref:FKBP-type peptidyl-prolyl cis-trans isomerase n=1 Tax=Cognataquiflexum rubidum TaxID=2922273 RepID=UPI001F128D5D|nr:FKBP-type peptidyl-prolyl cis-trans isomerase [Cognataquiflexum rubidum]MCH6234621.1 FKBP-type peptidyl-prolyl cis-trans isomerase [Cognataquiflexum rubidum]